MANRVAARTGKYAIDILDCTKNSLGLFAETLADVSHVVISSECSLLVYS